MGKKKKQEQNKVKRQMKIQMQKAEKERDLMQEWKEWGRMWPLTAEGMEMIELEQAMLGETEGRHEMATYETEPAENRRTQWLKWAMIGIAVIGAIALAMML